MRQTISYTEKYPGKELEPLGVSDYAVAAQRFEAYLETDAFIQIPPLAEAVRSVINLSKHYRFIAVTSRLRFLQEKTIQWLQRHFGETVTDVLFTHFIMSAGSPKDKLTKVEVCKNIGATFMIEAHIHHAVPVVNEGIEVFLLDQPWNQSDVSSANIRRMHSWMDIENDLLRMVRT